MNLHAKKILLFSLLVLATTLPVVSLAAGGLLDPPPAPDSIGLDRIVPIFEKILDIIWGIFVALSIAMFLWAGFLFLTAQGEASQVGTARKAVIWGIVGLIVALFAFSITSIVKTVLGL